MPSYGTKHPGPGSEHIWTARLVKKHRVLCGKTEPNGVQLCTGEFGQIRRYVNGEREFAFDPGWSSEYSGKFWRKPREKYRRGVTLDHEQGIVHQFHRAPTFPEDDDVIAECPVCHERNVLDPDVLHVIRKPKMESHL